MVNLPATQDYTPHSQTRQRQSPASPQQKILIARLCMALGETEPLEERTMSVGEAGGLIYRMILNLRTQKSR